MDKQNEQPTVSNPLEHVVMRIAAVVGCPYSDGLIQAYGNWIDPTIDTLRAKAWCFDLLIQYKLVLEDIREYYAVRDNHRNNTLARSANPNLAIIKAVIEQESRSA